MGHSLSSPKRAGLRSRLGLRLAASLVTAAATVMSSAAMTVSAAPALAADTGPAVGVQFHGMWSDYSDAQRAEVLDKLQAAHVGWVRLDVSWAMLQPDGPNSYSTWGVAFVDRVVDMARARGLKVLVTLWLTPGWANRNLGERTLPDNPADYTRVASWAANHFGDRVSAWEVWNEPNQDGFMHGADPAAYTRLLKAGYQGFHAGNPSTTVVFGGPAYNDRDWIARAYAAGAHGYFDAMATHPYMGVADQAPETPDDGTMWTLTHVAAVHTLMSKYGDGDKPIWFTEFGWSSHGNSTLDMNSGADNWMHGVTADQQGDYFVRTIKLVRNSFPYVTNIFWYNERNVATTNIQNANYGLLTRDLQPKPAYTALKSYLSTVPTTTTTTDPPKVRKPRHTVTLRDALSTVRIGSAVRFTMSRVMWRHLHRPTAPRLELQSAPSPALPRRR